MPAKEKNRKKKSSAKKSAAKKTTPKKTKPAKKQARRKPVAANKPGRKIAKKPVARKAVSAKPARTAKKHGRKESPLGNVVSFQRENARARSGGQSGDLQGLSNIERSNSESVDELLEEGNAFEAEAVAGVENAGNADEEEVHTHEVSEDDVPAEYLDKD